MQDHDDVRRRELAPRFLSTLLKPESSITINGAGGE